MSLFPDPDDLILRFERRDGRAVRVRKIASDAVAAGMESADVVPVELPPPKIRNARSPSFSMVRWNGVEYTLTKIQAAVVAVLWQASQDGVPYVTGELLLEESDSAGKRLDDLFRRSNAWGTLVCRGSRFGGPVGTFCLAPPDEEGTA